MGCSTTTTTFACALHACVVWDARDWSRRQRLIWLRRDWENRCTVCSVRSSNVSWRLGHGRSRRRVVVYTLHILHSAKVWGGGGLTKIYNTCPFIYQNIQHIVVFTKISTVNGDSVASDPFVGHAIAGNRQSHSRQPSCWLWHVQRRPAVPTCKVTRD
jgi:hypothetical protein